MLVFLLISEDIQKFRRLKVMLSNNLVLATVFCSAVEKNLKGKVIQLGFTYKADFLILFQWSVLQLHF